MVSSNTSNLDQEHEDLTRLREEESRKLSDTYRRFIEGHNEMEQRTQEIPLNPGDAGLRCVICVPLISLKGPGMLSGMNVALESINTRLFFRYSLGY